jgi:phosphomannomutase
VDGLAITLPPLILLILIANGRPKKVVIGRDGRISGPQVAELAIQTLIMMGIEVIDTELSTTPTVEMEVTAQNAGGGIILTASHNPKQWNALKFLNDKGEFISAEEGATLLELASSRAFDYAEIDDLGSRIVVNDSIERHINKIHELSTVNVQAIRARPFTVVVDCINSTGAISIPPLLESLGCKFILLNEEITGEFAHNPEPLEIHLRDLAKAVIENKADMGVSVDPDVDRLAFIDENGKYCGEEYTLVMIADWILSQTPGNTVSNLSSTIALKEVTEKYKQKYAAAAVGEVNVVTKIRETNAIIGGEGNGGIIYPTLHAGRDALVGIALILTALTNKELSLSQYRGQFPDYTITKKKIDLTADLDVETLLQSVHQKFSHFECDTQDGLKVYLEKGWAHLRKSNTEPIIRLIVEASNMTETKNIIDLMEEAIENSLLN